MGLQSAYIILCLIILSVTLVPVRLEPIFGRYYCDAFCADYEDDSTSESGEDFFDLLFDPCIFCPSKPSKPAQGQNHGTTTTVNPLQQLPFNFQFPPIGLNMTMGKTGNNWFLNFWPFNGGSSSGPAQHPSPGSAATPAPAPASGAAAPAKPAAANATKPAGNATKPAG